MHQLIENLGAIRKTKSAQCKFRSILVCIFFYAQNIFTTFGKVAWKVNKSIAVQIGDFFEQLGDNFESVMTSYFDDFKQLMKKRLRIPISPMEKHFHDVYFLVDTNHTHYYI